MAGRLSDGEKRGTVKDYGFQKFTQRWLPKATKNTIYTKKVVSLKLGVRLKHTYNSTHVQCFFLVVLPEYPRKRVFSELPPIANIYIIHPCNQVVTGNLEELDSQVASAVSRMSLACFSCSMVLLFFSCTIASESKYC